ncbi:hypothetical protein L2E82_37496 [Cichorium intybus]|uniref:Uncharacterized protein n=1 Tax=Cichorium intybus TaxID=13427 RepID=A0ACB9ADN1_CICIN|nr:hypothetical protein L2E82_37496 [Cichorium intybus]
MRNRESRIAQCVFAWEQRDRRVKVSRDASIEELKEKSMIQELIWTQNLQGLLDLLLHIRPKSKQMLNVVVLEAMHCVVIEIYDICGRICNEIGSVLVTMIYEYGAKMALSILQKAKIVNRNSEHSKIEQSPNEEKSIMKTDDLDNSTSSLKTLITDDWEVFQDQQQKPNQDLELIELCSSPT